jgi:outer membrane protein OmpA-like peptidoglycan-associated protein
MRLRYHLKLLFLCLLITACQATGSKFESNSYKRNLHLSPFLEAGYKKLYQYELNLEGNVAVANKFKEKMELSARGQTPSPAEPTHSALPDEHKEEAQYKYLVLVDAIEMFNTKENALQLAQAQLNYECWLERIYENNTVLKDSYIGCHDYFYQSIKDLKVSLHKFSIYFESNSVALDAQAQKVIEESSGLFIDRPLWEVHLIGYTDSKGSYEQNVILSMRRAMAIKNALAQHGINPDKIVIDAEGERSAKKQDLEDEKLRRVEIFIMPEYLYEKSSGPDIRKIMPHFFGTQ